MSSLDGLDLTKLDRKELFQLQSDIEAELWRRRKDCWRRRCGCGRPFYDCSCPLADWLDEEGGI